jgi:myo-inositol-hexaphosphate 3-phosphohydrolase
LGKKLGEFFSQAFFLVLLIKKGGEKNALFNSQKKQGMSLYDIQGLLLQWRNLS